MRVKGGRWVVWLGAALSLGLLAWLLLRIDWQAFFAALRTVNLLFGLGSVAAVATGVALRTQRWRLIAAAPARDYGHFWRAVNLGYLGNLIYPARAGEALRMVAINRFAGLPVGQAMSSAVIDRAADILMLGLFTTLALGIQGGTLLGPAALIGTLGVALALLVGVALFVVFGERWRPWLGRLAGRLPPRFASAALRWFDQALAGSQPLRQGSRLAGIGLTDLAAFLADYTSIFLVLNAFGWHLPVKAALIVGVFLSAGAALPSAPGAVGIYQAACVLALRIFGIDSSAAVAFALVLQLSSVIVIVAQGGYAALQTGLLRTFRRSDTEERP